MARSFLTSLDLNKNELRNAAVHNLGAAPTSPVKGQLYFDTAANILYWWDGTAWQSAKAGSGFPGYGSVPAETTFGLARADGVATTVARSDHTHGSPVHDAAAHSTIPLNSLATATAAINMGGFRINNLADPFVSTDAATKNYVDSLVNGLSWKQPVTLASTANLTLSGSQTVDGVATTNGMRILVKNQTAPAQNGIYDTAAGSWTRSVDMDGTPTAQEMVNAAVFVQQGSTQADTAWVMTTDTPITVGTTGLAWAQIAGGGTITAGAGMTQSGNVLNVVPGDGSLTVNADEMHVTFLSGGNYGTSVLAARSDHVHDGVYVRKFSYNCSAGTSTVVPHNFGTRMVTVEVYRNTAPYDTVECDVERTDANNVTVRFATAVAGADFMILVMA